MDDLPQKPALRKQLRDRLAAMSDIERHSKSAAACALVTSSPEFRAARVIMLYLSGHDELDTAPIALRAWQNGKQVAVPKVSWNQRRMLPIEIKSLNTSITVSQQGIREPAAGQPIPVEFIDLVIVPGLGFSPQGHRIGRGMGFYDRFLGQPEFAGLRCGLAFEEQVMDEIPVLEHDQPLSMLITDRGIRRFSSNLIEH